MLCVPEEAQIVREFEQISVSKESESDTHRHHKQSKSFQIRFLRDVTNLEKEFLKLGSPFTSRDPELINIVSNDVMDGASVESVKSLERLGLEKKRTFIEIMRKKLSAFNGSIELN